MEILQQSTSASKPRYLLSHILQIDVSYSKNTNVPDRFLIKDLMTLYTYSQRRTASRDDHQSDEKQQQASHPLPAQEHKKLAKSSNVTLLTRVESALRSLHKAFDLQINSHVKENCGERERERGCRNT